MRYQISLALFVVISAICQPAYSSLVTIGPNGINSSGLGLTGNQVGIGQLERSRSSDEDFDTSASFVNDNINPAEVFYVSLGFMGGASYTAHQDVAAEMNTDGGHATQVAGVMISTSGATAGVAPQAKLYSAGFFTGMLDTDSDVLSVAGQHVATRNGGSVHAINISIGLTEQSSDGPDGRSTFSSFIDWSARVHDVLYVAAGDQTGPGAGSYIPADNFNGITVARSKQDTNGVYNQVSDQNILIEDPFSDRTFIDLLAPGDNVTLTGLGNSSTIRSGTSFAAPHVTGTVALLQEYANDQIPSTGWDGNARRHEVMKAVLMNSADKIEDTTSNGKYLGMERTVLKQNGVDDWFDSEAHLELETSLFDTPLDMEMGTGHLNAKRALQQFVPGEHELNGNFGDPTVGDVPHIGWDFGTISTPPSFPINKYRIEGTLEAGHFFSATLAWDREVEFANDADEDGEYDSNDTFQNYTDLSDVLQDLDLYLVPAGTNDVGENDILVSQSSVTSVEHIFGEIPETGEYELWVYRNEDFVPDQDYGLAWWYGLAPPIEPPDVTGDFDGDGDTDGKDFLAWQRGNSPTPFSSDDLGDWQAGYGSPLSALATVPEPSSLVIVLLSGSVMISRCRV